jgi:cytochrome bd ubiquinol oxidase subunit II
MTLQTVWFCLIGVLWGGYFLLEGFDFGVGMLLPYLPRHGNETERSMMFETIGPVWDGNEVWLVVAAGATFAAFPTWYATMFSGFYIALLLVLVLLIVRVVSFEWREKHDGPRWRTTWMWANTIGSLGAPFIWGVALANLLNGVPLNSSHAFVGNFLDLFRPYTVLAGLAVVVLFALHGATYLTLRTLGDLRERAAATSARLSAPAAVLGIGLLAWTVAVAHTHNARGVLPTALIAIPTALALLAATVCTFASLRGSAFAMTGLSAIGVVATIFTGLYPRVLVSHPTFTHSLTITNATAGHYALTIITIAAAIFTPIVLLYQSWTYYIFRQRVGGDQTQSPVEALAGAHRTLAASKMIHARSDAGPARRSPTN